MRRAVSLFGAGLTVFFVMFFAGPPPGSARAATPARPEEASTAAQRAKQHYLRGEAYFKAKSFSEAMDEYQKGYLEKPDPVFIFNMAQCQRLLGNSAAAVEFYQRYLKEAPDGPGRPVAEKQIAELRGPAQLEPSAPPETPPPLPPATTALPSAAPPAPAGPALAAAPPPAPTAATPPAPAPAATAPLPTAPSPASGPPVLVTTQTPRDDKPIYTRWYFWTAVAATVVSTIVVAAATSSNRPNCDAGRVCR